MACHVCGGEAVDRCFTCGRLFCEKHGKKNCVVCQNSIMEGDPSPERVTASLPRTANTAAWWRPQPADEYVPPACYICKGLTRAVCRVCGRNYCAEHAGRNFTCRECSTDSDASLYIVGGILIVFVVLLAIGYWLY